MAVYRAVIRRSFVAHGQDRIHSPVTSPGVNTAEPLSWAPTIAPRSLTTASLRTKRAVLAKEARHKLMDLPPPVRLSMDFALESLCRKFHTPVSYRTDADVVVDVKRLMAEKNVHDEPIPFAPLWLFEVTIR